MSKVKFTRTEKTGYSVADVMAMGYSILDDSNPEIIDCNTGKRPEMKYRIIYNDDAILYCTKRTSIEEHIDIMTDKVEIVYDLGAVKKVEQAVVRSYFFNKNINYTIDEFILYASDSRENLFSAENEVAHIREIGWEKGQRNTSEWGFDVEGAFRYYGIKILSPNPTDDIARLGYIGLYSAEHTYNKQYLAKRFPKNLFFGQQPFTITDGVAFDNDDVLQICGEQSFTFKSDEYPALTKLWVVGDSGFEVSASGFGEAEVCELEQGRAAYEFNAEAAPLNGGEVTVKICGNGRLDQIGAFSNKRVVGVNFDDVICEDFMGIGANCLPMSFMPESMSTGYNEVYWALERERLIKAKPNVVRMWFQPDWLCDTYEQYKNGEYKFDCQKMQSVYRYLEAYKAGGTEVEFNFGWKVAKHAQEWFSLNVQRPECSAPKDLELFAKCCCATLKELVEKRGFDNIKYLSFYNEPNYGDGRGDGDFAVGEGVDGKQYWEKMMRAVHVEMQRENINYVKFWASEQSGTDEQEAAWVAYNAEHCSDLVACHTNHRYKKQHCDTAPYFNALMEAANGAPVMLTECGQNYSFTDFRWDLSEVQLFHDLTKCGLSGALLWCVNSMVITEPCSFTMRNTIDYWDCPQYPGGIENVRENYYRWAMLSHYVPNHCKSVQTEIITGTDENIRATAFTTGDDYTVVLELDNEGVGNREIEIKLGKKIGKKFYKHVYRMPCKRNGNATLPPVENVIFADDTIFDTVNSDYQEVVYTTVAPVTQVELSQNEVFLTKGQKYELCGTVIDGSGDIAFELAAEIGDSAIFDANNRTASFGENAKKGDMFAVKAYAVNHPDAVNVVVFKYLA